MSEIRAFLYDLLGYFVPGCTTMLAVLILVNDGYVVDMRWFLSTPAALWLAAIAYVTGHVVQAVANSLWPLNASLHELLSDHKVVPRPLLERVRTTLSELTGLDKKTLKDREMFGLMDEYRLSLGNAGEREMFVHREGFYRGMTISSVVFAAALIVGCFRTPTCVVKTIGAVKCLTATQHLLACVAAVVATCAFYRRWRRQGEQRFVLTTRCDGSIYISTGWGQIASGKQPYLKVTVE